MEPLRLHIQTRIPEYHEGNPDFEIYTRDKMAATMGEKLIQALSNKPPSKVKIKWEWFNEPGMVYPDSTERSIRLTAIVDRSDWVDTGEV